MPTHTDSHPMACMEIWGGNRPADNAVSTPGLEVNVISRPLDGAGGDVHYVSLCGGGLITRILLADIAGHGTPVASLAGDLRNLIRRFINTKSQSRLVSQLNEQMQTWSSNGIFATSMVATYLANKKELTLCNAGHPRPLFYRARTDTWELLDAVRSVSSKPADLPLGVLSGTTYPQTTLNLEPGDHLVLYTDLMIEAHDASGIPRGEPGLLELTRRLSPHGELLGSRLVEEVLSHAGPNSPADDITVLELRQTGQGPRPPGLAEKLQVYGKFFGLLPV